MRRVRVSAVGEQAGSSRSTYEAHAAPQMLSGPWHSESPLHTEHGSMQSLFEAQDFRQTFDGPTHIAAPPHTGHGSVQSSLLAHGVLQMLPCPWHWLSPLQTGQSRCWLGSPQSDVSAHDDKHVPLRCDGSQ